MKHEGRLYFLLGAILGVLIVLCAHVADLNVRSAATFTLVRDARRELVSALAEGETAE